MNPIILVALFVLIGFLDIPQMVKEKQWRSLILYSVLLLGVFSLGILLELDINIPSPIKAVQYFYQNILHLSFK